ncbi:jg27059 [Pararge aegeria aegeria]|uniref:Jg27059 protein n=1 Tax=Pararge aegeria aegeria TaxID=348720 RepID=A0A8S4S716_9NEOP|nr:jg27059 [Pararge aegeria aegeria]
MNRSIEVAGSDAGITSSDGLKENDLELYDDVAAVYHDVTGLPPRARCLSTGFQSTDRTAMNKLKRYAQENADSVFEKIRQRGTNFISTAKSLKCNLNIVGAAGAGEIHNSAATGSSSPRRARRHAATRVLGPTRDASNTPTLCRIFHTAGKRAKTYEIQFIITDRWSSRMEASLRTTLSRVRSA